MGCKSWMSARSLALGAVDVDVDESLPQMRATCMQARQRWQDCSTASWSWRVGGVVIVAAPERLPCAQAGTSIVIQSCCSNVETRDSMSNEIVYMLHSSCSSTVSTYRCS